MTFPVPLSIPALWCLVLLHFLCNYAQSLPNLRRAGFFECFSLVTLIGF